MRARNDGNESAAMTFITSSTSAARRESRFAFALIGAGKFGSMFLSQVPHTRGSKCP